MSRYSKKSQYTTVDERAIYVLHSPISKLFYIGHCRKDLLNDVFKDHLRGERYKTVRYTDDLKNQGLRPCLHILDVVSATKVLAYRHVIAWTKIFCDHGYEPLDQGNVLCYMEDMLDATFSVYQQHKDATLSEMLICSKCIVNIYNRKICQNYKEDNHE